MAGDASAYAALGLQPGAGREAVERAYRRLIKDHHPDRAGGDAARAAEITSAYRELRERRAAPDALILDGEPAHRASRRLGRSWLLVALILACAAPAVLFIAADNATLRGQSLGRTVRALVPTKAKRRAEPMKAPIASAAIDAAVRDALRISASGDEMEMTDVSRACHDRLRAAPSVALLDRCAAFDDAVVQLQDRDPLRNRGRFSELAVTGRQWSAAKGLSDNFEAIDDRLDELRLRAELAVAGTRNPDAS